MAVSQYFLPRYRNQLLDQSGVDYLFCWASVPRKTTLLYARFIYATSNFPNGRANSRFFIATKGPNRKVFLFLKQASQAFTFSCV